MGQKLRLNESYQKKSPKISNSDTLRILQTEWCATRWLGNSSLFQSLWTQPQTALFTSLWCSREFYERGIDQCIAIRKVADDWALSLKTLAEEVSRLTCTSLRSSCKFGVILLYSYPYTRTAGAWTVYSFQKFQNAVFLEIFQIPSSEWLKLV